MLITKGDRQAATTTVTIKGFATQGRRKDFARRKKPEQPLESSRPPNPPSPPHRPRPRATLNLLTIPCVCTEKKSSFFWSIKSFSSAISHVCQAEEGRWRAASKEGGGVALENTKDCPAK